MSREPRPACFMIHKGREGLGGMIDSWPFQVTLFLSLRTLGIFQQLIFQRFQAGREENGQEVSLRPSIPGKGYIDSMYNANAHLGKAQSLNLWGPWTKLLGSMNTLSPSIKWDTCWNMFCRTLLWWYWFSSTVGNVGTKQRGVLQEEGWRGSSEQTPVNPPGQKNLWILQCTHCEVLVLHCKHLSFSPFIKGEKATKSQCQFLTHLGGFFYKSLYKDHTGRNNGSVTLLFPVALQDLWSLWGSFHSFYISPPCRKERKW